VRGSKASPNSVIAERLTILRRFILVLLGSLKERKSRKQDSHIAKYGTSERPIARITPA
jgi:hypothetical protein